MDVSKSVTCALVDRRGTRYEVGGCIIFSGMYTETLASMVLRIVTEREFFDFTQSDIERVEVVFDDGSVSSSLPDARFMSVTAVNFYISQ